MMTIHSPPEAGAKNTFPSKEAAPAICVAAPTQIHGLGSFSDFPI